MTSDPDGLSEAAVAYNEHRDAEPTRVPLGVWEAANDRAESWEESYRTLHAIALRLTHSVGSGEYVRAFDDLRDEVEKFIAEEQS